MQEVKVQNKYYCSNFKFGGGYWYASGKVNDESKTGDRKKPGQQLGKLREFL